MFRWASSGWRKLRASGAREGLIRLLLAGVVAACGGAPAPEVGPATAAPRFPAIETGSASPGAAAEAARLLLEARRALEADSLETARTLARRVTEELPRAPGSSEALWIEARAAEGVGELEGAAGAVARFRELLPAGHGLAAPALVLHGRVLLAAERWEEGVRTLFRLPASASDSAGEEVLAAVRRGASEMSFRALEALVEDAPPPEWDPLLPPVLAEYALGLYTRDRVDEAVAAAERSLDLAGPSAGPEMELARSIVAGEVTVDRRSAVVLGALLPSTGSPTEQRYATLIRQGIEARLQSGREGQTVPASLEVRDDSGSVSGSALSLSSLVNLGTVGIIGPLGNQTLEAAAEARTRTVPILSPTAQEIPEDAEAVYSLNGRDPGAALALARYAASRNVGSAVIVHAGTPKHSFEARTFAEEFRRLGGSVLRQVSYPPGSTFFEEPLRTVRELLPDALVLPVPVADVQLVAPQLTYFGLDTLGVRVLGTEEWGEPEVVSSVEPRHLNGVVVATPRPPGGEMPGWAEFVERYESLHRETLRSRIPALGYDAAGLLLEAVARGAREPEEIPEALEGIEAFEGATGYLYVENGRILRRYHLMRLRNRETIPVAAPPETLPGTPAGGAP